MPIAVSVPAVTMSRFVVAADDVPKDPYAMARAQITGPPGDAALEWLGTPLLTIRAVAAADSVWRDELERVAVFDDDERERLLAATGHLIIESELSPHRQPEVAQGVRAVARTLADATDGLLTDLCTGQLVLHDRRVDGERDWFCLADRWLGFDCHVNPDSGTDDKPTECACLCLFTRGMNRFGVPDLVVDEVPCAYDLAATNVMRGLATHLLGRLWAGGETEELRLEESLVVEPESMWGYWGAHPLFGKPVPVRLAESRRLGLPADRRYLEILPRSDFEGTRAEWSGQVLNEGLSSVAGWQPDDPPYLIGRAQATCEGG
jgi:hypothetical protein